jgi:sugar transferase (PEP-CTERM system associated)
LLPFDTTVAFSDSCFQWKESGMVRIFHVHVPLALLGLGLADAALLYALIGVHIDVSRGLAEAWPRPMLDLFPQKAMFVTAVMMCLFMMGVYTREHWNNPRALTVRSLVALGLSFVMLTVIFYATPSNRIWMSALLPAMIASALWLVASRYVFRRLSGVTALKPRILVLGAGPQAHRIEEIERSLPSRFTCIGFVPMGPSVACVDCSRMFPQADVRSACATMHVDEVVIALEESRNTLPIDMLLECRLCGIRITTLASFVEREVGQVDVDCMHASWLVFSDGSPKRMLSRTLKRALDIVISLVFLVFTLPATLLTALAIWCEDGWPIFYRQERTCLYGKTFNILKFRSMRRDAERDGVARWAAKRDPRITRVGAFIRKTRLDEIPQIWNVLKGDMSFVGPRPERPMIIAEIAKEIPFYENRHLVKPGITGWAQINYGYGDSIAGAREKLKYDLYYVKNCSVFLDLIIVLQTAQVIFWPSGAR